MTKQQIAADYRRKYGQEMPTLTLAKILYHERPMDFKDLEHARSVLRIIEGKNGARAKKYITDKSLFVEGARPYNPYKLPESYEEKQIKHRLALGNNNILILSDIHAPYHNIAALSLAIDYGKAENINTVVLNGDIIDNHFQSKFQADLRKRRPKDEFDTCKAILRTIREAFPDAHIHWIKGNHDVRWERWLMQNAGFIWDDSYFSLEERLRLNEEKITLHDDRTIMEAGDLHIAHGHYLVSSTAPSAAKALHDRTGGNFLMGHLHKRMAYSFRNADGKTARSYITGCLCEKYPNYNPQKSQSECGFAHAMIEKDGSFTVKNIGVDDNKILF